MDWLAACALRTIAGELCFVKPPEGASIHCGGNGLTDFYGMAKPVRTPQIGPPHAPWREVVNQPAKIGDLRIEECLDEDLHRYVRTERLFDTVNVLPSMKLPELPNVRIMAMSPQALR